MAWKIMLRSGAMATLGDDFKWTVPGDPDVTNYLNDNYSPQEMTFEQYEPNIPQATVELVADALNGIVVLDSPSAKPYPTYFPPIN